MKTAKTAPTMVVIIAKNPPPIVVTKLATVGNRSNTINEITIMPRLMSESTPPRSETIRPDKERPLTVLDFIKSKMNKPVPIIDKKNAKKMKIAKILNIGVGPAQTQHKQEKVPQISDIIFINGCLNLTSIG